MGPTPSSSAARPRTAAQFLRQIAAYGDTEAVVDDHRRITYRQLDLESAALAKGLLAWGVGKGAWVGLWLGNTVDWVVAWAAVSRIGAVAVPISTFFRARELAAVIEHADIVGLITHEQFLGDTCLDRLTGALPELAGAADSHNTDPRALALLDAPFLRWVAVTSAAATPAAPLPRWAIRTADIVAAAHGAFATDAFLRRVEAEVAPGDEAIMIHTSGSTAAVKGVPHTHDTVMAKTWHLADMMELDSHVRSFIASPFFWVGGLTMSLFPVLSVGGTQYCADRFDAARFLDLVARERIDRAVLYPHHIESLLAHPDFATSDRSSLRDADPRLLPAGVTPKVRADGLRIGLGMTETFGGYWWGRPDASDPRGPARPGERRPPPFDVAAPGYEIGVFDPDGAPVGTGGVGEICLRSAYVTTGLHKRDRSEVFDREGWFHTGDLVEVDGDRLHFRGRIGDMIKTAGANVSPGEVSAALREIPGVDAAYVVGIPDPVRGQVVAAAVVPAPDVVLDPDSLRAALRDRVSVFKVPAHIVVLDPDEVPWTASHKVRTGQLAEMIAEQVAERRGQVTEGTA